jgi:hypothetical protein
MFLLRLGHTLMQLVPHTELLSADSLLQDIIVPAATLAMALSRAYACDKVFSAIVMTHVLAASGFFLIGAVSGQAGGHSGAANAALLTAAHAVGKAALCRLVL